MAPSLKPPGKNGRLTAEDLITAIIGPLSGPVQSSTVPLIHQLLPILVHLQSPQHAKAYDGKRSRWAQEDTTSSPLPAAGQGRS